jgi:NAD-specific glutamate dehydrogenase
LREDLLMLHRRLACQILETEDSGSSDQAIDHWVAGNGDAVERWLATLAEVRASRTYDTTTLPVALREVRHLIQDGDEHPG